MDAYKTNPNWTRPDNWKWEDRMNVMWASIAARNEKHGFIVCPQCDTEHTRKTVSCRECEHKVEVSNE